MPNYADVHLSMDMYNHPNKTLTEVLEELDPSPQYVGTRLEELDAFERQLRYHHIQVAGESVDGMSDVLSDFFKDQESSVLFYEYVRRKSLKTEVISFRESGLIMGILSEMSLSDFEAVAHFFGSVLRKYWDKESL